MQEGLSWDVLCVGDTFPPPSNRGCTPGYWKNHTERWTNGPLVSVFSNVTLPVYNSGRASLGNDTLLEALRYRGGSGTVGAAYILLRASTTAYLNSQPSYGLNYPVSTGALIARINAALASQNRVDMPTLATQLDIYNNLGCPLN